MADATDVAKRVQAVEVAVPGHPAESADASDARPALDQALLASSVEAALLTSDRALSLAKLSQALGLADDPRAGTSLREAIATLNQAYEETGRSFRIEAVAGGYRAVALARFAPVLAALHGLRESQTLSRAAVESLAIIAYRQPITRADLESIRGVACGEVLRSLLEKKLIDVVGRAEDLGRPMLYGTTKRFLETFGLSSLKDLPNHQDFAPGAAAPAAKTVKGSSGKSKAKHSAQPLEDATGNSGDAPSSGQESSGADA